LARLEAWFWPFAWGAVVAALPLLWVADTGPQGAATYEPERVLQGGHEAEIMALLVGRGDGPLQLTGVAVRPDAIEAQVDPSGVLVLRERGAAARPLSRTAHFDVSFEGPASLRGAALAHARLIAARDTRDLWTARDGTGPGHHARSGSFFERHMRAAGLEAHGVVPLVAIVSLLCLFAIATLRGHASPAATGAVSSWGKLPRLVWVPVGISLSGLVGITSTFHFILDDFRYLHQAAVTPWAADPYLRWLAVTARFSLLAMAGDPEWIFALLNVAVLAVAAGLWGALVVRLGHPPVVAMLSAVLVSMGPGVYTMVRWASGFEHLSSHLVCASTILLVDLALRHRTTSTRHRLGFLALAGAVAVTGMFTKANVLVVLPPVAMLWVWLCLERSWRCGALVGVYLALLLALPVYFCSDPVVFFNDPYAVGRGLPQMTWNFVERLFEAARGPLLSLGLLALVGIAKGRPIRDASVGSFRPALVVTCFSAVFAAPFVLQAEKLPTYYVFLSFVPVSLALACATVRAIAWARPPVWMIGGLLLTWVPFSELVPNVAAPSSDHDSGGVWAEHGADAWLGEVVEATAGHPAPERIFVEGRCDARSRKDIVEYKRVVDTGGIAWATGFLHAEVTFDDDGRSPPPEDALVISHCRGRRPRVTAPARTR
jgi:hypothetical protein